MLYKNNPKSPFNECSGCILKKIRTLKNGHLVCVVVKSQNNARPYCGVGKECRGKQESWIKLSKIEKALYEN